MFGRSNLFFGGVMYQKSLRVAISAVLVALFLTSLTVIRDSSLAQTPNGIGDDPRVTSDSWFESSDLVLASKGDVEGFHLWIARERARWSWKPLATILPGGGSEADWTGYACLTGTGDYAVAVVAPSVMTDSPYVRDRGATAYVVEVATGAVWPVLADVALKYFNPGCGNDNSVALIRHLGVDQEASEVVVFNAGTRRPEQHFGVRGQLASAVPSGDAVYVSQGTSILRIAQDSIQRVAKTEGQPYMLRANADGVDFLVANLSDTAQLFQFQGGALSRVGEGPLGRIKLFSGSRGKNVVVGSTVVSPSASLVSAVAPSDQAILGSSLRGRTVLLAPQRNLGDATPELSRGDNAAAVPVTIPEAIAPPVVGLPLHLPPVYIEDLRRTGLTTLPAIRLGRMPKGLGIRAPYSSFNSVDDQADGAGRPATCAVPRNHDRRQVPQPNTAQVDWAIQMATRNLLNGSNARPANFLNLGLAGYSPSSDFPRRTLSGALASTPVPPSVIQAVFAQESAWRQASFRALPGVAGNPLVSDYYGAGGDINNIDYLLSDCGYGLGQVTTPMTKTATAYSANGKTKVAVDYAENTAASIQFLVDKWNQLHQAGIVLNDGDPSNLENWYFAIWAYNTGFHANSGSGPWGLGWTNNPMNSDYPPDRTPFLRQTYADAEHPSDWPYQERVFGWMETPLLNYKGEASYAQPFYSGTNEGLHIPGRSRFCSAANECDPNYLDPSGGDQDYCLRADRKCWWHDSVSFVPDCAVECADSTFTYATSAPEPPTDTNYAPACDSSLSASSIIVDDLPDPAINVEGCAGMNWSSRGTFEVEFGKSQATGDLLGVIDWHQLGGGFGGHTWFTKNRSSATDVSHISTATWTPAGLTAGLYNVSVHVPSTGASTASANYRVLAGNGLEFSQRVDQHQHRNHWASLGNYTLHPGAQVKLTNLTGEPTPGTSNVAFDAVAFTPLSAGGTIVRKRIDAVSIFDPYQRLDTDGAFYNPGTYHPFHTMKTIYAWAKARVDGILAYPRCLNTAGQALTGSCVGDRTFVAFSAWGNQVSTAGDGTGTNWSNETLPITQADWLGYSNQRLGPSLTSGEVASPDAYKGHLRLNVEFVVNQNGNIQEGSTVLTGHERAGDSHFPVFIKDIMEAFEADYAIALPDLRYSAEDLRTWTHSSTSVDPLAQGVLPGRAFMDSKKVSKLSNTCIRAKAVGGGVIGWRPMLAQSYVRDEVESWLMRVEAVVEAGKAPEAVELAAREIKEIFFSEFALYDPNDGSGFYVAPSIWTQVDAKICAGGSVTPGASWNLGEISWMPDLYLFVDNLLVNLQGESKSCNPTSRNCAVTRGDFFRFSHLWWAGDDPWDICDFAASGPNRNGNPWNLSGTEEADVKPTSMKYCDESTSIEH